MKDAAVIMMSNERSLISLVLEGDLKVEGIEGGGGWV
jgi:hypothetical protein